MAEAVAFGASVVAFIQLTDRVISLCKRCIDAAREGGPAELRSIFIETTALKSILENLQFLHGADSQFPQDIQAQTAPPMQGCQSAIQMLENELAKLSISPDGLTSPNAPSKREIKHQVLKWLERTNPSPLHNQSRQLHEDHTGQWMLRNQEWQKFREGHSRSLWIHGIPGAGKTILSSYLIEQLQQQQPLGVSRYGCTYYYCYFGHNQDETEPLLRWIIVQLCRQASNFLPQGLALAHERSLEPTCEQLMDYIAKVLDQFDVAFLAIDAVDESKPVEKLLSVLEILGTDLRYEKLKLLITSRKYVEIECCMAKFSVPVSMSDSEVEEDIRLYVNSTLKADSKFRWHTQSLRTEVEKALAKGAKGMFRWAVCQIDILRRLRHPSDIRRALAALPETLDETYERILSSIPGRDRDFVREVLETLAVQSGYSDVSHIREICGCLVRIINHDDNLPDNGHVSNDDQVSEGQLDSESNNSAKSKNASPGTATYESARDVSNNTEDKVLLAHYTVKEYLYSDRIIHSEVPGVSLFAVSAEPAVRKWIRTILEVNKASKSGLDILPIGVLQNYCLRATEIVLGTSEDLLLKYSDLGDLAEELYNPYIGQRPAVGAGAEPKSVAPYSESTAALYVLDGYLYLGLGAMAERKMESIKAETLVSTRLDRIDIDEISGCWMERLEGSLFFNMGTPREMRLFDPHVTDLLFTKLMLEVDREILIAAFTANHLNLCPHHDIRDMPCYILQALAIPRTTVPSACWMTPIQLAAYAHDYSAAKMLLEAGANPNALGRLGSFRSADVDPELGDELVFTSPLRIMRTRRASIEKDNGVEMEELLISYGAQDFESMYDLRFILTN
ncbi:Uu.00g117920.m01.CDS01 [Anthostomella pinea]|uniref:Uu.00g117920.m01.CDS01 n=1 Tax=Anthostomella pinea TaxID=933095 RepID=A0AAI8VGC7_9PEZI|nr:Uu.00g117920.m01.CDS01 [Anthostomella pinea]